MITVDGQQTSWHEGMTVAELVQSLDRERSCAVARIDGVTVSKPNFEKTSVADNAEVFLIPLVAGG